MILLSAHLDRVRGNFHLTYKHGRLVGLLDNILGVATVYHTLLDDPNIARLEAEGRLAVWHNQSEEWGELDDTCPKLTKKDVVIVVDVCASKDYKSKDFVIENVSGIPKSKVDGLRYMLEWEGFAAKVKLYDGDESAMDEAWFFRERKIPVLSFILPISCPDDGWHRIQDDSSIDMDKWRTASEGLKRVICYFA